jgi:hypothetical protein
MTGIPSRSEAAYSLDTMERLQRAFAMVASGRAAAIVVAEALQALLRESRERGHPAERLVVALKSTWQATARSPAVSPEEWDGVYRDALTRALAGHFRDVLP